MRVIITISPQLLKRPLKPLISLIRCLNGQVSLSGDKLRIIGSANLELKQQCLSLLSEQITSQLISGILLNSPVIKHASRIAVNDSLTMSNPVSAGYIRLTVKIMKDFGVNEICNCESNNSYYTNPGQYIIEPDYSSACYFWALGCILKRPVGISIPTKRSLQPDLNFLKIMKMMGAEIIETDKSIAVAAESLKPVKVDMKLMPDQVPTLAVLSLFTDNRHEIQKETVIYNIDHLRHKESDRIDSVISELKKIGVNIRYSGNSLIINPLSSTRIPAVVLDSHNDHRLAMSLSLLSKRFAQISVNGKHCVGKSFPDFFKVLDMI